MKKNCKIILLLTLLASNYFSYSQNGGVSHFIDLPHDKSCYIKAENIGNEWLVKLSNFISKTASDTAFSLPTLEPDSILNAIYKKSIGAESTKSVQYKSDLIRVKRALERLQLQYNVTMLAANMEITKKVNSIKTKSYIIPKKEWKSVTKLIPPLVKFTDSSDAPIGEPIRKKENKVYYLNETLLKSENKIEFNKYNLTDSTNILVFRKRQWFFKSKNAKQNGRKKLFVQITENKKEIEIKEVNIDINNGFIDNIAIKALDGKNKLYFTNSYPIPISTKKNINKLNNTFLFSNLPGNISYSLRITDFLRYYFNVEKEQYDLSPADTVIKFEFTQNKDLEVLTLNKENANKIFEYKIFTDVVGIDEEKPNGLVQFEAQRKIKLYTRYKFQRFPIGLLQYIEPVFKWNKIENKNSFLQPFATDTFSVDTITKSGSKQANYNVVNHRSVSPLDIYQYQQITAGFNLNLISGFNGNTKLKYYVDALFSLGRTKIRDSIATVDTSYTPYKVIYTKEAPKEIKANTIQWGIGVKVQFFPDARWGFTIGAKYLNIYLANLDFSQQNKTYSNKYIEDSYLNRGIISGDIQLHKNFKNDNRFYIRYVFNSQANNLKYNFSQFQIGYNAFLKF